MISVLILTGLLLQSPLPETTVQVDPNPHNLTLKDVISILADYDVLHRDQQPFFQPAFGVTNFDSNPPAIWLFNTADHESKESTFIHECLHVYYRKLGLNPSEEFIRSEETRLFTEIFGK